LLATLAAQQLRQLASLDPLSNIRHLGFQLKSRMIKINEKSSQMLMERKKSQISEN